MKTFRNGIPVLPLGVLALTAALSAQTTTPTPATCTTAPTSITNLSIERALSLSNILTTLSPNVPTNILAAIAGGAQEIRSRLIYNPQTNLLTDTTFLVATGSPIPTPLSTDVTGSTIQTFAINVKDVITSCSPVPSLLIAGTVASGVVSPFGNYSGAPAAIAIGYTTDNPPQINNVVELVAGAAVAWSASGQGTLTFPAVPVTPPTTNGGAPTIVLNVTPPAMGVFQVTNNPFQLDASASTDPSNLPLTFSWTSSPPANFVPSPNIPNPLIYFGSGRADYAITLTVTNSAGKTSTMTFTLEYQGR